jgi:hypothetical protein
MWPCSRRHVSNLMRGSLYQISTFYWTDRYQGRSDETSVAVRKGVAHNNTELPPLASVEGTGVLEQDPALAHKETVRSYKTLVYIACICLQVSGPARCDADITELWSFIRKSILAGDLNAKHPFRKSAVSNPSCENLMTLFELSKFEMSAPQCPTHYSLREMVTC